MKFLLLMLMSLNLETGDLVLRDKSKNIMTAIKTDEMAIVVFASVRG